MTEFIQRLYQRVLHVIGRGRVTTGDDSGNAQVLQVQLGEQEVKDNVPRLAEFGFTSMPPIGSDVVLLFIGGDRSNGAIIATGHQASRPKGLKAGETMIYTQDGKSIYLTADGGITIDAKGQGITIKSPIVDLDGSMVVGGNVSVGGGATGSFSTPTGLTVTVQDGIITNIN